MGGLYANMQNEWVKGPQFVRLADLTSYHTRLQIQFVRFRRPYIYHIRRQNKTQNKKTKPNTKTKWDKGPQNPKPNGFTKSMLKHSTN